MEPDDVKDLYDAGYAGTYDERFLLSPWAKHGVEFEISLLRELLDVDDPRWLDVGCGTGWVLSRFPGVPRAGLDISPSMLDQARSANPDALFLQQGDFRDDPPEWRGGWSLVSCMWTAYNYVASMFEFDQLLENMIRWTRPGGSVFIPVMDLEDLRYVEVGYEEQPDVWFGTIALTGATWTWDEPDTGKRHDHLVAPQIGHFLALLSPHFERIEVVRYPVVQPGFISRKVVVAKRRRQPTEEGSAQIVWHPLPADAGEPVAAGSLASSPPAIDPEIVASIHDTVGAMRGELASLHSALFPPGYQDRYDTLGVTHDQVGALRGDVSALHQMVQSVAEGQDHLNARLQAQSEAVPTPAPAPPFTGVSTKRIARELARRLNPVRRVRRRRS